MNDVILEIELRRRSFARPKSGAKKTCPLFHKLISSALAQPNEYFQITNALN